MRHFFFPEALGEGVGEHPATDTRPTMTTSKLVSVPLYWRISRFWVSESAAMKPSVHFRLKIHRRILKCLNSVLNPKSIVWRLVTPVLVIQHLGVNDLYSTARRDTSPAQRRT